MAYSSKPKTQRVPIKKPQELAIQKAKLQQTIKPQPIPQKPRVIQTTKPVVDKQMKPMRQAMVENKQTPKPLAGAMRTSGVPAITAGRITKLNIQNKKKQDMKKILIKKTKPLRGGI
jgi:hypothetical protein